MATASKKPDQLSAVIADDEALLAEALARDLATVWPELLIVDTVHNGIAAIDAIHKHKPDIVFLDIRMPGANGIEVAQAIAEDWTEESATQIPGELRTSAPPLIVFVTAFDDYAIEAFSAAAVDYLLKPVKATRLAQTVERLKERMHLPQAGDIEQLGEQIRQLLSAETTHAAATDNTPELRVIRASAGDVVRMIPVEDVVLFESADKYVTVYTEHGESLIRVSLRKLLAQLDNRQFVQIHRGAIVNLSRVEAAVRDDAGKITLRLKGHGKQPTVSRIYRGLFQAM